MRRMHVVACSAHAQVGDQIEGLLARQAELRAERDKLQRLITSEARAPKADWARGAFPWDAEVCALLRDRFGLQAFRWGAPTHSSTRREPPMVLAWSRQRALCSSNGAIVHAVGCDRGVAPLFWHTAP